MIHRFLPRGLTSTERPSNHLRKANDAALVPLRRRRGDAAGSIEISTPAGEGRGKSLRTRPASRARDQARRQGALDVSRGRVRARRVRDRVSSAGVLERRGQKHIERACEARVALDGFEA
jgi:hypothetical protein